MTSLGDLELLQRYATGSPDAERAFALLVERHLNLVYSVARRQVHSPQLAEEVAQSVFVDLARNARRVEPGAPLAAWLHLVSRRTAVDVVRRESRRQAREQAATVLADMKPNPSPWSAVEPLLDEAVESLPPEDRNAILLRFFESKSLREVGTALGTSDDAAQKRVSRALDQLRTFFLRRGVSVTAAGLAADLSANVILNAPLALFASISSTAAMATVGTAQVITMITLQKFLVPLAASLLVGGLAYEASAIVRNGSALTKVTERAVTLNAELAAMRQHRAAVQRQQEEIRQQLAALRSARPGPVPSDPVMEAEIKAWFSRVAEARRLAAERPDLTIPELALLSDDDWYKASDESSAKDDSAIEKLLSRLRSTAKNRFGNDLRSALNAYLSTHQGVLPSDVSQLAPFFARPADPAMLARYAVVQHGKLGELSPAESRAILIECPSNLDDACLGINTSGFTFGSFNLKEHTARAIREFSRANQGAKPANAFSLLPYFNPPLPARLQERFLQTPERFTSP